MASDNQEQLKEDGEDEHAADELLDLNDLRIFTYVAVLCSFSAAAEELRTSKSSVSRSIVRLERLLKTDLLQRTTRKVKLTRAGKALRDRGTEILRRVSDSILYTKELEAKPSGPLVVHISNEAGLTDLVYKEVLPQLIKRYASARFVVRSTGDRDSLLGAEADVAVFPGPTPPPGATRIAQVARGLVASPEYWQKTTANEQLLNSTIFVRRTNGSPFDLESAGLENYEGVIRVACDSDAGIRDLVLSGLGVGVLPLHFCASQISSRTLIHVVPEIKFPSLALYVSFPSHRQLAPIVREFVAILRASFKEEGAAVLNMDKEENQDEEHDEGRNQSLHEDWD